MTEENNDIKNTVKHNGKHPAQMPVTWVCICLCVFIALTVALTMIFLKDNGGSDTDVPHENSPSGDAYGGESVYPPDSNGSDTETKTETETDTDTDTETDTADADSSAPEIDDDNEVIYEFELHSLSVMGSYVPSEKKLDALYDTLTAFGRNVGFTAVDVDTGMTLSYNSNEEMAPASIIKAAYVYYVCTLVDKGDADLDDILVYTAEDTVHENGTIGKSPIGTEYTLRDVIKYTVINSDNEGYYMLIRHFGRSGYDEFIKSFGCKTATITTARWPLVTARDFALIWEAIYDYRDDSATGEWLYELFMGVKMHFIKNALGVTVASKAGWNADSYNDSGIVCGDRTYVLVILSEGSYYTASKSQYNAIVSAIDDLMSEYADEVGTPPDTDTSTPDTDTSAPDTDTSAPDTDTSTPDTDTSAPDTNTSAPDADTTAPEST